MSRLTHGERNLRENLNTRLNSLRLRVGEIWRDYQAFPHFTRHGPDHCERIEEHLRLLLKLLAQKLNLTEQYILLAAVWTHDIGMQDTRFSLDGTEITSITEANYETLRREHPRASEEWILDVFNSPRRRPDLSIQADDYAPPIARVARAHSNFDLADVDAIAYVYNQDVRLRLLAALLLIADELDLDSRRVNLDHLLQINISPTSKLHWWTHHYVNAVRLDRHTPRIHLAVPEEYQGLRAEEWSIRATAGLRKQLAKAVVRNTLVEAGCWLVDPEVQTAFDNSKRTSPTEIVLDTRAAVQAADICLLRGLPSETLIPTMGLDIFGIAFSGMSHEEQDRLLAAATRMRHAWQHIVRVQYDSLQRDLLERVRTLLDAIPLTPWGRYLQILRARLSFAARYETLATARFGQPRALPDPPDDDYCWRIMWEYIQINYPGHFTQADYHANRGEAIEHFARYRDEIGKVTSLIEEARARIVIAAVVHNRLSDMEDVGQILALIPMFEATQGPEPWLQFQSAVNEMRNDPVLRRPDAVIDEPAGDLNALDDGPSTQ